MTGTYSANTKKSGKSKGKDSPCGCGGGSPCGCNGGSDQGGQACCTTVCFERPNYFCGHLLTDDDLMAGQRYFREKNRLYHRTLHGTGIVCGLRVQRDPECAGYVIVGEGFGIDRCGNDLVVCAPQKFNVLRALKNKGYIVDESEPDPCAGYHGDTEECSTTQCFYLAAYYDEKQSDFESPLQNSCGPGPASCEPTRIQEIVTFDVLDCLPESTSVLDRIEEQFACCFRILNEGTFGSTMKANAANIANLFDGSPDRSVDYFSICCQLKAYFLQHLRKCPDPYDATLEPAVQALTCPPNPTGDQPNFEPTTTAFCELFSLVLRYVYDCILGQLVYSCPRPSTSGAVVLATLEIKDGKLARICHCGRSYVWSAANFWQVLLATLVERAACHPAETRLSSTAGNAFTPGASIPSTPRPEPETQGRTSCCPTIDINCRNFVLLYRQDQQFARTAALAPVSFARSLLSGAGAAVNFLDPNAIPSHVFAGMEAQQAQEFAKKLGINLQISEGPLVSTPVSHFQDALLSVLGRPGDTLLASVVEGKVVPRAVTIPSAAPIAEDPSVVEAHNRITELNSSLSARDNTIRELTDRVNQLTSRLDSMSPNPGGGQ